MGVHFYALSAESDPNAVACASQAMPNIVHVDNVEQVHGTMFRGLLQRRRPRGILVAGAPCQGNSSLNRNRQGLNDPRSCQPLELKRIVQELRDVPEANDLEIVTFLENVTWRVCPKLCRSSIVPGWAADLSAWMLPLAAGRRRRLFWLGAGPRGVCAQSPPPDSWMWADTPTLRFAGKKPVPAQVWWNGPFLPLSTRPTSSVIMEPEPCTPLQGNFGTQLMPRLRQLVFMKIIVGSTGGL